MRERFDALPGGGVHAQWTDGGDDVLWEGGAGDGPGGKGKRVRRRVLVRTAALLL